MLAFPLALAFFLAFLCAQPLRAAENDQLEQGRRLEAAGDAAGAARFYREWLRANPTDPRAEAVFCSLFSLESALADLLDLATLPGLGTKALLTLARLAELSGRSEEAHSLYRRAFDGGAGTEALVPWLSLSLAMDDVQGLAEGLAALRRIDPAWADAIDGMADLWAGRLEMAGAKLGRAASLAVDPRAAVAASWGLLECARKGGNPAAVAAAQAELAHRFPLSPETSLADGRVARLPAPAHFTGAQFSQPSQPPPPVAGPTYAVQAGSFATRENAEYLAADLVKKGFTAVVLAGTGAGRQVFKVFAASGLSRQAAEDVAARLAKAGFSGFVISEAR